MFTNCKYFCCVYELLSVASLVGLEGPMLSSLVFKGNYAIGVKISGHKCGLLLTSPNFTLYY